MSGKNENSKKKITCICGIVTLKKNVERHLLSKRHAKKLCPPSGLTQKDHIIQSKCFVKCEF